MVTQSTVLKPNEVAINNVRFKLAPGFERVRQYPGSPLPGKITLGDYNLDSHPLISTWLAVNDQRGGIGIDRMDVSKDLDRCWYSQCDIRFRGHLILPPNVTSLTGITAGVSQGPSSFVTFGKWGTSNPIFGVFYDTAGTAYKVHQLNDSTGAFGASVLTLDAQSFAIATGILNGSETIVIATGTSTYWSTAPTVSWTQNTTNITGLAFHNDLLWGLDDTGQLYFTHDLSLGWTADAKLPVRGGNTFYQLLEGNGPTGERELYAATREGLFIHDSANARFLSTGLTIPYHRWGGYGVVEFRGSIFLSAGTEIYKFTPGTPSTVTVMGPGRDDGLPIERNGTIRGLAATNNDLIATVSGDVIGDGVAFANGYFSVLAWDERGWRTVRSANLESATDVTGVEIPAPFVAFSTSYYRLYWAYKVTESGTNTAAAQYINLPQGITNPARITTTTYMSGNHVHETPWFDAGVGHQTKLAVAARLETSNPTSSESVKLEYATNYVESYTTLTSGQTTTGETEYKLPSDANPVGVEFRSIKFRLTLSRGGTSTNTPDVIKCALLFMRDWADLRAFDVTIDLTENWNGQTPAQQRASFDTIISTNTLMDFSFFNDTSRNRYVTLRQWTTMELPGNEKGGIYRLTLTEAH